TNAGNHLVFQYGGTGNTYTLQKGSTALGTSRVISFPATGPGLDCELVLSEATSGSTINGTRTFGSAPILSALTASQLVATNGSQALESVTISNTNGCNNINLTSLQWNTNMIELIATGTLSSTQILNINTSPVTVVAAASGYVFNVIH